MKMFRCLLYVRELRYRRTRNGTVCVYQSFNKRTKCGSSNYGVRALRCRKEEYFL